MTQVTIEPGLPQGVFMLRKDHAVVWVGGWSDFAPLDLCDELILGIADYRQFMAQFGEHTLQ
jgi:hypothetical protein